MTQPTPEPPTDTEILEASEEDGIDLDTMFGEKA
jgi:hypothetical protein